MEIKCYNNEDIKNGTIWRYMDMTKFISLISTRELYFPSPTELTEVDPFDSILPSIHKSKFKVLDAGPGIAGAEMNFTSVDRCINYLREFIGISCWYIGKRESYVMWNAYSNKNFGVAIRSTIEKLKNSIVEENETVLIGKVSYGKRKVDNYHKMVTESLYFPFFIKRAEYRHENELRLIMSKHDNFKMQVFKDLDVFRVAKEKVIEDALEILKKAYQSGKDAKASCIKNGLKVDIEKLIKEIYVAPNAPDYFVGAVKSIVKQYGLNIGVIRSPMFKEY